MKKLLLFLGIIFSSYNVFSQKTSTNEGLIDYEENSSWLDNSAPDLTPPDLSIDAYMFLINSINTANDITIQAGDTLYIEGNLTTGNNSNLVLNNNSVLVVTGNLNVGNKIDVSSNGTIAVRGTFSKQGSQNQGSYVGSGKVYASAYGGSAAGYFDNNNATADRSFDNLNDDGLGSLFNLITGGGPLPIELKSFIASKSNKNISLDWVTAKEENFSHFEVERSLDQNNWEQIGLIQGLGESMSDVYYDFTDKNAPFGVIYYRLKSVDIDASFEYSPVVNVKVGFEGKLVVAPNPVTDASNLKIQVPTELQENLAYVSLFDLNGMKVQEFRDFDPSGSLQIKKNLKAGVYILRINHNGLQENIRVVIQ